MRFLLITVLFSWILSSDNVRAEVSAILIGVTDYDAPSIPDLKGPKNDVTLMRDVLNARGVHHVHILADGIDGAPRPTRSAILAALAEKATTVTDGDFVVIYFSGHGSQQIDKNGDELDGRDEVILPIDAGPDVLGLRQIAHAITDDEIGHAVDRIRSVGAHVWLILDSCHSGTGLRATQSKVVHRKVDPETLGVDLSGTALSYETATLADPALTTGGVVAFYAAQASELAIERPLGADGKTYGLFTSKLAAEIGNANTQSFRQLFHATLQSMNGSAEVGGPRLQTPAWSGALIDAAVLSSETTASFRRYATHGATILAGLVHGLVDGTLVALFETASDNEDAVIGYAQVHRAKAATARLRSVAGTCVPHTTTLCPRAGSLPKMAGFGQVFAQPLDVVTRFAPPVDIETGQPLDPDHIAYFSLKHAINGSDAAVAISDETYDVEVAWDGLSLWFGPRTMVMDVSVGRRVSLVPSDLTQAIEEIAQAEWLARTMGALMDNRNSAGPVPIALTATVKSSDVHKLKTAGADYSVQDECEAMASGRNSSRETELRLGARIKQCDGITFRAGARRAGTWHLNRIQIDTNYCIHNEYLLLENARVAAEIGSELVVCSDCDVGGAGVERVFLVIAESEPNIAPLNLTGDIENCEKGAIGREMPGQSPVAAAFLETMLTRQSTRKILAPKGIKHVWVNAYQWLTVPKAIAFREAKRLK